MLPLLLAVAGISQVGGASPRFLQGGGAAAAAAEESEGEANATSAIAFAGGGFRAFTVDVGLTVGLLAARARRDGVAPTFADTAFLERFETISSNSGSTWFWAELAYSEGFRATLERMASSPESASAEFHRGWMQDWIRIGHKATEDRKAAGEPEAGLETADFAIGQATHEIAHFWRRGLSWHDFVHLLLRTTAGVDSLHALGDPVPSWLEGKVWLSVHSVVTGTPSKEAQLSSAVGQHARYHDSLAETWGDLPVYIPAKHSVVFGSGRAAAAPYPYFAESSGASVRSLVYTGSTLFGLRQWRDQTAPLEHLGGLVEARSGSLSVSGVASASSAVAGGICLSAAVSSTIGSLEAKLTPWAALALDGQDMFSQGAACHHDLEQKGVSRGRLRVCARSGVAGVIDGGYTEGSGVAQAVSVGADEVVMVVNDLISVSGLFQREQGSSETLGIPKLHMPIFSELYGDWLFTDVHDLYVPEGSEFLQRFMVATVRGTTIRNELFGIHEGRRVTLRVVFVSSQLQIGVLSDYTHYGVLAQEIAQCMLSEHNADPLENWLLRYI